MIIGAKVILSYGGDGRVIFRRPTSEEWNEFMAQGFPSLRGAKLVAPNAVLARVKLFDTLLEKFQDIEDPEGPLKGPEDCGRFPVDDKVQCIFTAFETGNTEMELIKNSNGTSESG